MSDDLEQRLRDALHAYADLVDAPDDAGLPVARAQRRPVSRRWRGVIAAAAAAAAVVVGSLVVVDVRDTASGPTAAPAAASSVPRTHGAPTGAQRSSSATAADQALSAPAAGQTLPPSPESGVPYAVALFTHCGVLGIDVGGVWFAADPPLVEGAGNPPAGWGNPEQPGTLTLRTATEAVFADDAGHVVRLRADDAARPEPCD